MPWPFNIFYRLIYPREKYIWAQIRILHETDKAILVDNGMKIWVPKSQIYGIRLMNNIFEIYVKTIESFELSTIIDFKKSPTAP